MSSIKIEKTSHFHGVLSLPGDKSISHRAVMISSIAEGKSRIFNLLKSQDCQSTLNAFERMGISIGYERNGAVVVKGKGLRGLSTPRTPLDMGNSGTTMRLLMGILAGQNFKAILVGDESLSKRPMKRVTGPLRLMGASVEGKDDANLAPISIKGGGLKAIDYKSPVASAQVKSAILLAGLYAEGRTKVTEPYKSRDHTERMLQAFGAELEQEGLSVSVKGMGSSGLGPQSITVPGDISSAAFFITLAVLAEDSEITIASCGINPTRTGILNVLNRMGAKIEPINRKEVFEPVADMVVRSSSLKAARISEDEVPLLIDEIPLIALAATQAEGRTIIEGAGELRVKETDRVNSILTNLKAMGADIKAEGDDIIINGPSKLKGAAVDSFNDHRTAMMSVIAGSIAGGRTVVSNTECIGVSFPEFIDRLKSLTL